MVEKAVEMGAGLLRPVLTSRTQASRINSERMHAHAIEAAEQCGILSIREIAPPIRLDALLGAWEQDRLLIFCDEDAPSSDPLAALRPRADAKGPPALAVLIGPEGSFDPGTRGASWLVLRVAPATGTAHFALDGRCRGSRLGTTLGDWRG
jgi:16S rRNA (uracil1498-N3)-methyltransferase